MEQPTWIPTPDFWFAFQSYNAVDVHHVLTELGAPNRSADPSFITDYFGMKIAAECDPAQAHRLGEVLDRIPFPTDTMFAEGIEYAALSLALRTSLGSFDVIELGAGFGPFVTIGALCARRLKLSPIHISAVEADASRFAIMRRHLASNGLVSGDAANEGQREDLSWRLYEAIVWPTPDEAAYWPAGAASDAGRKATSAPQGKDYRGIEGDHAKRITRSLPDILRPHAKVDLLHVDIQGSEADVLPTSMEALSNKVRWVFVATHSREIEGKLLEAFFRGGWCLEREEPCVFRFSGGAPTIQSMTRRDGGQVWRNPHFVPSEFG